MVQSSSSKVKKLKRLIFLKDVLIIAFSAFGGPNMHLALYSKRLVDEKKYLTTDELLEIYSLCQMLPGPSSTQTLISVGYKFGGAFLAFLTLITWALPATIILAVLALFISSFDAETINYLRFIQPVAVAFVLVAGVKMFQKVVKTKLEYWLAFLAFGAAALLRHPLEDYVKTPWIFPIVLVIAGVISYFASKIKVEEFKALKIKVPWRFLWLFIGLFAAVAVIGKISESRIVILLENSYRFGTIVFGGGNVLIPMMMEQFVYFSEFMSSQDFITGVGLVQAVPGPIFTIASYTGGLAMKGYGIYYQLLGSFVSSFGIFLPGTLLIFFVYPIWKQIKSHPVVIKALPGVIAASSGLVLAAAYLMFLPVGLNWIEPGNFFYTNLNFGDAANWLQIGLIALCSLLLFKTKIPSHVYVVVAIVVGIII